VLDLDFPTDTYLVGSQVVPGSSQVHHVLVYAMGEDRQAAIDAADAADPGIGYTCFGGPIETGGDSQQITGFLAGAPLPNLVLPTQIGSWVPGALPQEYPPGAATDDSRVTLTGKRHRASGMRPTIKAGEARREGAPRRRWCNGWISVESHPLVRRRGHLRGRRPRSRRRVRAAYPRVGLPLAASS